MAEPCFALKIGSFTCFCLNGTGRLDDVEHELRYPSEQSPSSSESYRSSRSTRRRRRPQAEVSEVTPKLLGRSSYGAETSKAAYAAPVKYEEAPPAAETRPTLLERRRLQLPGATPAKGGATPAGASPKGQQAPAAADVDEAAAAVVPPEETVTVEESALAKMDLSGSWVLARVEGDMDAWLKDIGISWAMRAGAKAMKYGAGKMTNVIKMTGESMELTTWTPKGDHTSWLKLDGTESRNTDPMDGRSMLAVARWEGHDAIFIETRREDDGKVMPTSRRFLRGDEMCVEQLTPNGLAIQRVFARQ